jgi:hypothetical protein
MTQTRVMNVVSMASVLFFVAAGCQTAGRSGGGPAPANPAGAVSATSAPRLAAPAAAVTLAAPAGGPSAVGRAVASVIAASAGQKVEFFDKNGTRVQALPTDDTGSVSIHTLDRSGQDNYTFDKKGQIVKHLRSYGDHYKAATWVEIK